MGFLDFLDPEVRRLRKVFREIEHEVSQASKPYNEFLRMIVTASSACATFAETLIQTHDEARKVVITQSVFSECAALFSQIGLRIASNLRLPDPCMKRLVGECFDNLPHVVAEAFFSGMSEPDKTRCIEEVRRQLINRVKQNNEIYDSRGDDHFERLMRLFLSTAGAVCDECQRTDDWDRIREPIVETIIEQWRAAAFQQALAPLAKASQI
jgi:hypothetical protein